MIAPVIAAAVLVAVLAAACAHAWWRLDRLTRENRRLRKQVEQRGRSADRWMERAGIAEQALADERQQWFAEADELLAREQRHAARCPWAAAGDAAALARHHTAAAQEGLFPKERWN